jgi:hypothetical protein
MNRPLLLLFALAALAAPLLAHETEVYASAEASGYRAGLTYAPRPPVVGQPTEFALVLRNADGSPAANLAVQGQVVSGDGKFHLFFAEAPQHEPGEYRFSYTFQRPGEYGVEFIFRNPAGDTIQPTFKVTAEDPRITYTILGGIAAGVIILALAVWRALPRGKGRKRKPLNVKVIAIGLVLGIAAAGLGYSLASFYAIGGESGFIVCGAEGCLHALHVHAQVDPYVCGEYLKLELEKGRLDAPHTHKERNRIHVHRNLHVDPNTGQVTAADQQAYLSLGSFMDAMEVPFTSTRLDGKSNGDACPDGKAGTLRMWVNGQPNTQFREYIWKDGDRILLAFGELPAGVSVSEAVAPGCGPNETSGC